MSGSNVFGWLVTQMTQDSIPVARRRRAMGMRGLTTEERHAKVAEVVRTLRISGVERVTTVEIAKGLQYAYSETAMGIVVEAHKAGAIFVVGEASKHVKRAFSDLSPEDHAAWNASRNIRRIDDEGDE